MRIGRGCKGGEGGGQSRESLLRRLVRQIRQFRCGVVWGVALRGVSGKGRRNSLSGLVEFSRRSSDHQSALRAGRDG